MSKSFIEKDEREFSKIVIKRYKPLYEGTDKEHGLQHTIKVMRLALYINRKLNLGVPYKDLILASISHDVCSTSHRENHETKGAEFVLNDKDVSYYNEIENMDLVCKAIAEHRGSYKGSYSSVYSEIISAADRGEPVLKDIVQRVYKCAINPELSFKKDLSNSHGGKLRNGSTIEIEADKMREEGVSESLIYTWVHLMDKFSVIGYARYNDVYKRVFQDELVEMWSLIDDIADDYKLIYDYIKDIE